MTIKTQELKIKAKDIRKLLLTSAYKAKSGHIGSSLSTVELLAALYFGWLKLDPKKPAWPERDVFILSKGHGCLAYYAILAMKGYFPRALLAKLFVDNTTIAAHPTTHTMAGVEFSSGSLGHGLAVASGMAYGFASVGKANKVAVMLSDGECDEGSIWEAALKAGHLGLGNLLAIVDYNKIQAFGRTEAVGTLEPFKKKWQAFGWQAVEINGHNFQQIFSAFSQAAAKKNQPTVIIAHTIKGKGVKFMEDTLEWHYLNLDEPKYHLAVKNL